MVQDLYSNEEEMQTLIQNFAKEKAQISISRGTFKSSKISLMKDIVDILNDHEIYHYTTDYDAKIL